MSDAAGMAVMLASLILTLLWFALGSVVRLLNRIETHLSRTEAGRTIGALNQS
jgi:type II secretory pathway component PulJ